MKTTFSKILIIGCTLLIAGCAGMKPTVFLHPQYNLGYVERVAVIPFENLTADQGAGARITRLFITELLSTETFEVVEPGEVSQVMQNYGVVRTADLSQEQIKELGRDLGVQALFLGSVNESSQLRSGSSTVSVVTLVISLLDTESGVNVWSATHTQNGRSLWATLLGTGEKSHGAVSRECVSRTLGTLIQ